jgi:hypothetical protein
MLKNLVSNLKNIDLERIQAWLSGIKPQRQNCKDGAAETKSEKEPALDTSSSLMKILMGDAGIIGEYHFPSELIGGTCPRVAGEEESIVWNAAAEVCDTERVHVVWQSVENRIWYLAIRSEELASYANTWCPFASMLPGMKNAAMPPVCYTHYSDETATLMTITADSLQIIRGTTTVVRAKAERAARELNNAPIIELTPDRIMELEPVPWYSLSLFENRARRILAAVAVFSALGLATLSLLVWLIASMGLIAAKHDLNNAMDRARTKSMALMRTAETLRISPVRDQLAKFSELNDKLLAVNGYLEVYEIKDSKTRWRAYVPVSTTADRITDMGGKTIDTTDHGVAIGNDAEIEYEASKLGNR